MFFSAFLRSSAQLACVVFVLMCLSACREQGVKAYQGYVEGEFVYLAAPLAGQLDDLYVVKGQSVRTGDKVFVLERAKERAGVQYAEKELASAMNTLEDMRKGSRPTELAQIEAQLKKARVEMKYARLKLTRREALYKDGSIAEEDLDDERTLYKQAKEKVRELAASLETSELGSREDQIKAAAASVEAARAQVEQAKWAFDQKTQAAPCDCLVYDVIYRKGEYVAAGNPVVSLLPPENRKVRFFVPQADVAKVPLGTELTVSFDGGNPLYATVNYVATTVEYTPPVIYSSESRAKLVMMIEAVVSPKDEAKLQPGQPVDVYVGRVDVAALKAEQPGFWEGLFSMVQGDGE